MVAPDTGELPLPDSLVIDATTDPTVAVDSGQLPAIVNADLALTRNLQRCEYFRDRRDFG